MNVSVGSRWESFVEGAVRSGRYGSASEVVREGLRLVEEREARLRALRATLEASIAAGGEVGDAELDRALAERDTGPTREGEEARRLAWLREKVDRSLADLRPSVGAGGVSTRLGERHRRRG